MIYWAKAAFRDPTFEISMRISAAVGVGSLFFVNDFKFLLLFIFVARRYQ